MTLAPGSRLGPYEILSAIGAGGMGEVYRAKDPRLGREVAIKVLPASFSQDADRLRRFEQEAKAAGILNHPNITAVYDIGTHEDAPYVVQELLEGETLRSVLAGGKLAQRKTIDYALQIAHGLAAAHEKGIVHRDLKPENLFVTRDGRVKILDFGLAKLTHQEEGSQVTNLPTATAGTEPGVVLGTLGYMAPEQVRGKPADARSDIFSFGAILYEMLSGKRAFQGDSAADTMSAILKEDPPDLSVTNQNVSPGLERIVRHCLEKNPEQRFHSAHDLAFDLEALSTASSAPAGLKPVGAKRSKTWWPALFAAAALALAALAFWTGQRKATATAAVSNTTPVHQRITFRRGNVLFARFTADGQTVVYSAAWGDRPAEIFLTRVGSPESRPLGIENANLLSVSPSGELAILLKKGDVFGVVGKGTLARVPLGGGTPRQIEEDVDSADWLPDGTTLAAVRRVEGKTVLEFPVGKRVYSPGVDISFPRVSPDGRSVALIEGPNIVVIDAAGKRTVPLSHGVSFVDSIAWHPSGREIWFAGTGTSGHFGMYAVDMAGKTRLIVPTTDLECLHDIGRDGSVLVEREISTREIDFASGVDPKERDLSWLDQSYLAALSPDGKAVLLSEGGQGGGPRGAVYLRKSDGSPASQLGEGYAFDLSPDRKWALTVPVSQDRVVLLPTGAGQAREIRVDNLTVSGGGFVPPDGKRIAIGAVEPGHGFRLWVLDASGGGKPRPVSPEGLTGNGGAMSPDGKFFAANGPDGRLTLYPLDGGDPRPIEGVSVPESPVQWSGDGQYLYLARFGEVPVPIDRFHIATKKREPWKQLAPTDRAGLVRIEAIALTRDGQSYAYSFNRVTNSDLYVVTGWK